MGKKRLDRIIEELSYYNGEELHPLHWRQIIASHIGSDERTVMSVVNILRDSGALIETRMWFWRLDLSKL